MNNKLDFFRQLCIYKGNTMSINKTTNMDEYDSTAACVCTGMCVCYRLLKESDRRRETTKWYGMGVLMKSTRLPEDMIKEIGDYLYLFDTEAAESEFFHNEYRHKVWDWTHFTTKNFLSVKQMYYTVEKPVLMKPILIQTSRWHRKKMRRMNIQFLKVYEIIKERLYYRSDEYYNSQEYKDDLRDDYEDRMRDSYKDMRDDRD